VLTGWEHLGLAKSGDWTRSAVFRRGRGMQGAVAFRASVASTNGPSISVSRFVTPEVRSLLTRPHHGLALFGPFNGYGTTSPQGTAVVRDVELLAKTEFTSKLVRFVSPTGARIDQERRQAWAGWEPGARLSTG
jgi:hypothetical protein